MNSCGCRALTCPESSDDDDGRSKEAKERRSRATSTVYTVDATQKTSMNGLAAVSYSDDQSPLSTLKQTGRQQSVAEAAAAWRRCSAVQSDVVDRSSPLHVPAANRRPASNECLRRPETSSPAEVIYYRPGVAFGRVCVCLCDCMCVRGR